MCKEFTRHCAAPSSVLTFWHTGTLVNHSWCRGAHSASLLHSGGMMRRPPPCQVQPNSRKLVHILFRCVLFLSISCVQNINQEKIGLSSLSMQSPFCISVHFHKWNVIHLSFIITDFRKKSSSYPLDMKYLKSWNILKTIIWPGRKEHTVTSMVKLVKIQIECLCPRARQREGEREREREGGREGGWESDKQREIEGWQER